MDKIENVFNYINDLEKYFNLIVDTIEAKELMKQEVKTENYQRNRWDKLTRDCETIFGDLFLNFDKQLLDFGNILSIEITKRNGIEQKQLHDQLNYLLIDIAKKFHKAGNEIGFSNESTGTKSKTILAETAEGGREEKKVEFDFSIALFADDFADKLTKIHKLINDRFKFIFLNSNTEKSEGGNNDITDSNDIVQEENEMKTYIESHFETVKERCFDKGYDILIDMLTNFFEGKNYVIPKDKIQLKVRCKTTIAPIFNKIYMQKKSGKTPLKSDTKYFEIIRVLNHFQDLNDNDIYKTICR